MALNSAALAYSDKIMRDYLENMDESMKKDWETTYPDIVQRDEIMRAKAFDNASWNCDSKYYSLENESLMIADRADRANNYANIIRNGGGSKSDYANLGLGEDFVPLNDYTEKTGFFGLGEANRKGLKTKLSEMQGNDENAVAVRDDLNARIAKYESMAAAQDNDCKKYNEQYAQFTDNMSLTMAERNLASAFARGASEEEINNLSTEWAKLNVDYYNKYEKDMVVNSQADAQKASERASEIAAFKELLGIEDSSKTVSATQPAASDTVTKSESKTTDQPETKSGDVEAEATESKTVEVKEVKSASDEKTEPVSEKPNPYAFEKPACPPGMPGSAYEAMCKEQEAAHIKEVNARVADEIWTKGNWGNGQERIDKLTAAGYDVAGVQAAVNEKIAKINEASSTRTVSVATPEMKSADNKQQSTKSNDDAMITHDEEHHVNIKSWTDENGNKITERYYDETRGMNEARFQRHVECADGKVWDTMYRPNGNKESETCFNPDNNTQTAYLYNVDGNKERMELFDKDNKLISGERYDGSPEANVIKKYRVDEKTNTSHETYYDESGNVTSSEINDIDNPDTEDSEGTEEIESQGFQPINEPDDVSPDVTESQDTSPINEPDDVSPDVTESQDTSPINEPDDASPDVTESQDTSPINEPDDVSKKDSKDDSGKSVNTWIDDKGNEITDVTITDENNPLYNTMLRSIKCPDGKTWSIAYGADGKPDNARCIDPNTGTFTDIKYNEDGYKELSEIYDVVNGKPGKCPKHVTSYDGTENERKVADVEYDHKNRTISERYYDSDGNVVKSDFRELDSADDTPPSYDEGQPGFQASVESEEISADDTPPSYDEGQPGFQASVESEEISADETETQGETEAVSPEGKTPRRTLDNSATDRVLSRTEEKSDETKPFSPYLQPGEVDSFNPYVNEPAFDPHLDVPNGDLSVDVPKGDLSVDVPKFDPYVDIKIDPYISATESNASQSPKKVSSNRFNAGIHIADSVGTSGKSASFSNGPDAD